VDGLTSFVATGSLTSCLRGVNRFSGVAMLATMPATPTAISAAANA